MPGADHAIRPASAVRIRTRIPSAVGIVALAGSVAGGVLAAQAPASLAFDVASVKPNTSVDTRRGGALQPGRLSQTNVTLLQLIQQVYSGQIVGAPGWIGVDRFDIDAKGDFDLNGFLPAADGSPPRAYLMLRTLLADRFKLKVHTETREAPAYALEIARSDGKLGPQLHKADVDCGAVMAATAKTGQPPAPPEPGKAPVCSVAVAPGRILATGVPMSRLAGGLSRFVNRPVVDRTNLIGDYAVELQWSPDQPAPDPTGADASRSPSDLPSMFTALREQLGLKLESIRTRVDVLVIDHVEHPTVD
jgi:uncharacterized protein (TIGR03435 family)